MILQNIALRKGKEVAGHNIQSWAKRRRRSEVSQNEFARQISTGRHTSTQLRDELAKEHVRDLSSKQKAKKEAKALDRDFFISVLGSSATKRDARAYIQQFTPTKDLAHPKPLTPTITPETPAPIPDRNTVNLGELYGTARAVSESPRFVQRPSKEYKPISQPRLHVALVKIRAPQTLDEETIDGVGRTLSQLGRLGLTSVVVVDCNDGSRKDSVSQDPNWRSTAATQADRIVSAIETHGEAGARLVNNVLTIAETLNEVGSPSYVRGNTYITMRKLLLDPLKRGVIPVVPCMGYTDTTQASVSIPANDVVLTLAREFIGLQSGNLQNEKPETTKDRVRALQKEISLDRLIILDPLGGIPASDRESGYHVFLNLEQEFESARRNLTREDVKKNNIPLKTELETPVTDLGLSNPFSRFVEGEFNSPRATSTSSETLDGAPCSDHEQHVLNLELARSVLSMLPPSSSALLTTPNEAANSGKEPDIPFQAAGVGTRRKRNPLIHNLLTDKPVFSSSLPMGRLGPTGLDSSAESSSQTARAIPTTFAKHGMCVTILPDPIVKVWQPPRFGKPQLTLTNSNIDLPRLVHLIEDSFGRKLDVEDYLKRVNDRIAGVIIAGEYEGGAILTWETPPGVVDDGSSESRARMVPYLDKFAVLKRSQGSGGTADVVFKAMVRDCFPQGVCWRSRKTNVVNKWYFERSRGTWKLPNTGWTMFWTTPDLSLDPQKFRDYEGVCRNIEPSWADNKALLD